MKHNMTKNIKLTADYEKYILKGTLKGKKIHGYDFLLTDFPPRAGGEGFKVEDVIKDPTKVPIYDHLKGSPTYGQIIRYEGTVENPIKYYACDCGNTIAVPNAEADKLLNAKIKVKNPAFPKNSSDEFLFKDYFEEVV